MSDGSRDYVTRNLENWTTDDVAEWLEDNKLFYLSTLPMKELDGRALCELAYLQHQFSGEFGSRHDSWIEFLVKALAIDYVPALKFSYCLRGLLKSWQMFLAQNATEEERNAPNTRLYYP